MTGVHQLDRPLEGGPGGRAVVDSDEDSVEHLWLRFLAR
jgi:hypothetical protein